MEALTLASNPTNEGQAVLARNDPNLMFDLAQKTPDDLELLEQLLAGLPSNDWRSPVVLSRIKRLRHAYTV